MTKEMALLCTQENWQQQMTQKKQDTDLQQ